MPLNSSKIKLRVSSGNSQRALSALVLCFFLAISFLCWSPDSAFAEVRKTDRIMGETVEGRGLSVAQCPSIDAQYAYVMDEDGTVYFERDAQTQTQIASITKIMTAIVALENAELDTPITVSEEAAQVGESSAELKAGDTLTLENALYALLIPSGNDAAIAIGDAVGALIDPSSNNPQQTFVDAMNAKAKELGMKNTLFANTHGLDFDTYAAEMYSSAEDVAIMAQYAMENETFQKISASGDTTINVTHADGTAEAVEIESTDKLIGVYEGACGIKTGFTALAGECFAGASNRDGFYLFAIVLNSSSEDQRFTDATTLFDWVYEHRINYVFANSDESTTMEIDGASQEVPVVAEVAHAGWIDSTFKATFADPEQSQIIFDLNGNISQTFDIQEPDWDVKAGDKLGTVTFKQRNNEIATLDVVAAEDCRAPNLFEGIGVWWDRFFRSFSGAQQQAETVILNKTPLINDKSNIMDI